MKYAMLFAVICAALILLPVIPGQSAMAASFGIDRAYGIGGATFQGSNHTWKWNWWPWRGNDNKPKTRSVPVPGTFLLFGAGLAGLVMWRTRQGK